MNIYIYIIIKFYKQIESWKTLVKLENITEDILKKIGLTNPIPIIEENEELKSQNAIILKELDRVHESRESGNAIYRSIIRENVGCIRDLKTNLQEKRDSLLNKRKISANLEQEIVNLRLEVIIAKSELKEMQTSFEALKAQYSEKRAQMSLIQRPKTP